MGIADEFLLINQARGVVVPDTELQSQWLERFKQARMER